MWGFSSPVTSSHLFHVVVANNGIETFLYKKLLLDCWCTLQFPSVIGICKDWWRVRYLQLLHEINGHHIVCLKWKRGDVINLIHFEAQNQMSFGVNSSRRRNSSVYLNWYCGRFKCDSNIQFNSACMQSTKFVNDFMDMGSASFIWFIFTRFIEYLY